MYRGGVATLNDLKNSITLLVRNLTTDKLRSAVEHNVHRKFRNKGVAKEAPATGATDLGRKTRIPTRLRLHADFIFLDHSTLPYIP